jgi:hypothetical protein
MTELCGFGSGLSCASSAPPCSCLALACTGSCQTCAPEGTLMRFSCKISPPLLQTDAAAWLDNACLASKVASLCVWECPRVARNCQRPSAVSCRQLLLFNLQYLLDLAMPPSAQAANPTTLAVLSMCGLSSTSFAVFTRDHAPLLSESNLWQERTRLGVLKWRDS